MKQDLAMQYAKYDNQLNKYFDHVLLDLVSDEFREEYYALRIDILTDIFKEHNDDMMIRLIEHYNTVKSAGTDCFIEYEVELLMIEHYMELCGYTKDELGYWKKEYDGKNERLP